MQAILESRFMPGATPAEKLQTAAAAGADGLIIDGEAGQPDWTAWKKAASVQAAPLPRLIGRVALELPVRTNADRDWRRVLELGERPSLILRVRSTDNLDRAYRDALAALEPLVSDLVRAGIHPILEPVGTLARSRELWFIREAMDQAAGPGAISVAWRPLEPAIPTDAPSVAIMRLIRSLELVFTPPIPPEAERPQPVDGEGKAWMPLSQAGSASASLFVLEQLKGMSFDRMICLSRVAGAGAPKDWAAAVAELRAEWAKPPIPLSAYKGDKNAPKFVKPGAAPGADDATRQAVVGSGA